MGSSSLPASIVNLLKAIIGTGILGVPFSFAQTGVLLGVVLLMLCAVATCFAYHLLAICVVQARSHGQDASFRSLALRAFSGSRTVGALVSICLVSVAFGIMVAYLIVIGDLLPEVVDYLDLDCDEWNSRTFWITVVGWCIELPLCFLSNLDSLKFSSMLGTTGIAYMVIVTCLCSGGVIEVPQPEESLSLWPPDSLSYTSVLGMLESCPIFVFALNCALNIPALVVSLEDSTLRNADIMIMVAVSISFVVYMVFGISGGMAFGASVAGNVLVSFPTDHSTTAGLVSIVARVAVVINVMGSIPLFMHALRDAILQVTLGKASNEISCVVRASYSLVLFLLAWSSAMVVESVVEVMALVGSTGQMMLGFCLPALLYYYSGKRESTEEETTGVRVPINSAPRKDSMKSVAWVMAVVSSMMIPCLLAVEVYKMVFVR